MAVSQSKTTSPLSQLKRIYNGWKNFFARGDLTGLILVTALLLMPPLALRAAEWPVAMRTILPITIFSTVFGLVLARSKFSEFMALLVSSIYGMCLVVLLTASVYGGDGQSGVYTVFVRFAEWLSDVSSGGINRDNLVFTLLVALLFWFLGYNAAWHVFRVDRIWRVVLPPGLILMTNSIFYGGDSDIDTYLVIFLFLALLLIARSNLNAHEWHWYNNGIRRPRQLRRQFLWMGGFLAFIPLLIGSAVPSGDLQSRLDKFQEFLQSDPLTEISEFWNRVLSPIDAIGPTTADYYGGDSLELGGAIRLGDQDVFLVDAPPNRRYYWRSRVFDTYEQGSWTPAANIRLTDSVAPMEITVEQTAAREIVEQEFTIALNATRILYTAPQPFQVNSATRTDLFYTAPENDPSRTMNVSVVRPTSVIRRGESYSATSLMSVATATELRAAGQNYPEWVTRLYLYISPWITDRTIFLADQIVIDSGAITPYDQAKAIERYLRQNISYNESIPTPPQDQDPIDWVLFDLKEGYCNYYASAMIVMLRSRGIPARMAAGFAEGNYDSERGVYVVTERDAHTWVEAYFPGYGWIEFEPTAAQSPLDRDGDNEPPPEIVSQPSPVPSPTATFTPLPTATPIPTATPPDQADNPPPPSEMPTLTPTFTPSPTPTPVIVPTQPAPMNPQPDNPLQVILPAIGLMFAGLLVLLFMVLIGLLLWWWWEIRGFSGLGPVARAYARLERYVSLLGIQLAREQTTEERRKHIIEHLPSSERPVTAITRLYMRERYGRSPDHPAHEHQSSQISERAWSETRKNIVTRWLRRRFLPWRNNQ